MNDYLDLKEVVTEDAVVINKRKYDAFQQELLEWKEKKKPDILIREVTNYDDRRGYYYDVEISYNTASYWDLNRIKRIFEKVISQYNEQQQDLYWKVQALKGIKEKLEKEISKLERDKEKAKKLPFWVKWLI